MLFIGFFFQAEDGIRDAQESRGLGDVYKRQVHSPATIRQQATMDGWPPGGPPLPAASHSGGWSTCLLYTSDAADDLLCVDLGGRRIIKKKKNYTALTF